jgi:ABC-2 type transport system ATP-binding protein
MTCDRVVIINKGKVAAVDTPANLTAQLKGGQKVRVETQAPENALRDLLQQVPGASDVQVEAVHANGHIVVTVEAAMEKDIRSAIAAKIVEKGWPLFELRGMSLSLEEIFLELTTQDAAQAQPSN